MFVLQNLHTGFIICSNPGIILCMRPANERRRYYVTSSLIGWVHAQNDPWIPKQFCLIRCHPRWPPFSLPVLVPVAPDPQRTYPLWAPNWWMSPWSGHRNHWHRPQRSAEKNTFVWIYAAFRLNVVSCKKATKVSEWLHNIKLVECRWPIDTWSQCIALMVQSNPVISRAVNSRKPVSRACPLDPKF